MPKPIPLVWAKRRKAKTNQSEQKRTGGPDRTRTCDLRFRKPLLYPAELRDPALKMKAFLHSILGLRSPLLPKLLPSLSFPCVQASLGKLKCSVETGRRIALHGVRDVRVQVKGGRDRGVAKPLLCDLGMHSGAQELGSVAVAQIVKADGRKVLDAGYQPLELVRQALRLERLSIRAGQTSVSPVCRMPSFSNSCAC